MIFGEVAPEELYYDTALQGVLQDNEDVELVNYSGNLEEGIEIVNMTQSILQTENRIAYV